MLKFDGRTKTGRRDSDRQMSCTCKLRHLTIWTSFVTQALMVDYILQHNLSLILLYEHRFTIVLLSVCKHEKPLSLSRRSPERLVAVRPSESAGAGLTRARSLSTRAVPLPREPSPTVANEWAYQNRHLCRATAPPEGISSSYSRDMPNKNDYNILANT